MGEEFIDVICPVCTGALDRRTERFVCLTAYSHLELGEHAPCASEHIEVHAVCYDLWRGISPLLPPTSWERIRERAREEGHADAS